MSKKICSPFKADILIRKKATCSTFFMDEDFEFYGNSWNLVKKSHSEVDSSIKILMKKRFCLNSLSKNVVRLLTGLHRLNTPTCWQCLPWLLCGTKVCHIFYLISSWTLLLRGSFTKQLHREGRHFEAEYFAGKLT